MIAKVAVALGDPARAVEHARRCLDPVEADSQGMEDWDAPFAQEVLSRALALHDQRGGAVGHWQRSMEPAEAVADPEDREILQAERDRSPW